MFVACGDFCLVLGVLCCCLYCTCAVDVFFFVCVLCQGGDSFLLPIEFSRVACLRAMLLPI